MNLEEQLGQMWEPFCCKVGWDRFKYWDEDAADDDFFLKEEQFHVNYHQYEDMWRKNLIKQRQLIKDNLALALSSYHSYTRRFAELMVQNGS